MMDERQQLLCEMVEKSRQLIFEVEEHIWKHPETGFREWNTSAYLEEIMTDLGYDLIKPEGIPGFFTDLDTGRPGPRLLIMGELDALVCQMHAEATDGKAHACGHHAQCAALIGLAAALKEPGALDGLSGTIRLMAVPAEELIEVEWRETLRQQGVIKYYGGKTEFMHRGYLDDVDLAFMIHTAIDDEVDFACRTGTNGCLAKCVTYEGVASHAGGSPHLGINALYAAQMGMQGINAIRETFRDDDHVRVHPIMTAGGQSVNIIPSHVKLESFVRGASLETIAKANLKVNRALAAGAVSLGARVHIMDRPGYAPLQNDPGLMKVAQECMEALVGPERVRFSNAWGTGSTDMGDVSCVMPAIHPYASGASGTSHGNDFRIKDRERACMNAAKAQLLMADRLLRDQAQSAKEVIEQAKPQYPSIRAYLDAIDAIACDRDAVIYQDDQTIDIRL
jgi:amidohydrolase